LNVRAASHPQFITTMHVEPATPAHLAEIRAAYAHGRARQLVQETSAWPEFTDAAILREIESGLLFRVLDGDEFAGVFSVAYEDPAIWGDDERGAHIYLHRISRAPTYSGRGMVDAVVAWAVARCEELGREGLRMDTWADNSALVDYYSKFGFTLLGTRRIPADPRLSPHYHGIQLALLERPLPRHLGTERPHSA
jgi:ribosomal protein S18 acetylase RimI-like enzyme